MLSELNLNFDTSSIGAELLVSYGLASKLSSGVYDLTYAGSIFFDKFIEFFSVSSDFNNSAKVKNIKRAAKRPGPRQLLEFTIMQWRLMSESLDPQIPLVTLITPVLRRLIDLKLDVHLCQTDERRVTIEVDSPRALRHSICTLQVTHKGTIDISLGIECALIALLAQEVWPEELGTLLNLYIARQLRFQISSNRFCDQAASMAVLARVLSVDEMPQRVTQPCILLTSQGYKVFSYQGYSFAADFKTAIHLWRSNL